MVCHQDHAIAKGHIWSRTRCNSGASRLSDPVQPVPAKAPTAEPRHCDRSQGRDIGNEQPAQRPSHTATSRAGNLHGYHSCRARDHDGGGTFTMTKRGRPAHFASHGNANRAISPRRVVLRMHRTAGCAGQGGRRCTNDFWAHVSSSCPACQTGREDLGPKLMHTSACTSQKSCHRQVMAWGPAVDAQQGSE